MRFEGIEITVQELMNERLIGLVSSLLGRNTTHAAPSAACTVQPFLVDDRPHMKWTQSAFQQVMRDIAGHAPERGGILLGPVGDRMASHFVFDDTGAGSPASWTFGHVHINEMLKKYAPLGLDMKGFVHSHPSAYTSLSPQDLADFRKPFLNAKNGDLTEILAPLVVDGQIYPYILFRDNPKPVLAQIILC